MVLLFKQQFSVFKQRYMYFHPLFHLHIFSENNNNVISNLLRNGSESFVFTSRGSHNTVWGSHVFFFQLAFGYLPSAIYH